MKKPAMTPKVLSSGAGVKLPSYRCYGTKGVDSEQRNNTPGVAKFTGKASSYGVKGVG